MQHNSTAQVTIYALCEPDDPDAVRYVGQTRQTLNHRLAGHISEIRYYDSAKNHWVQALLDEGKRPLIRALATTTESEANGLEAIHIAALRAKGCAILNDRMSRPYGRRRKPPQKKGWIPVTVLLAPETVAQLRRLSKHPKERGAMTWVVRRIIEDALAARAAAAACSEGRAP